MDRTYENDNGYDPEHSFAMEVAESSEELHIYAGFWMRFWAYLCDLLIVFSLNGILLSPLLFMDESTIVGFVTLQGLLSVVFSYLYFLLMTKFFAQTLGKMIFGIKVIRADLTPLKWSDLFFREVVGRFIHRSLVITNVLYLVVGFMDEKQGVHDIFAGTRVVHVKNK